MRTTIARILVATVFAINVICAVQFIAMPGSYTASFQVQGPSAQAIVQSVGICFLMWNATYPPVITQPGKHRVLFGVVIAQQVIGLVGESLLLASLAPELGVLFASIVRFVVYDAAGLVLLLIAFALTRHSDASGTVSPA